MSRLCWFFFLGCLVLVQASDKVGKFSILLENAVVAVHLVVLPDNRLLAVERSHQPPYPINQKTNGEISAEIKLNREPPVITVSKAERNAFCSGKAQMANGDILFIGGDLPVGKNNAGEVIITDGLPARRIYVPCKEEDVGCAAGFWKFESDMSTGRWYPTVTTLSSGEQIIVSGSLRNLDFNDLSNANNPTYEYYPSKNGSWPRKMDVLDWAFPFNLYPAVFQLSTGSVMLFVANRTVLLQSDTEQVDSTIPDILLPDKLPWIYPYTPTFVMLPLTVANGFKSVVMGCGGSRITGLKADERCIQIDFSNPTPAWVESTPMPTGLVMPDSVILPDGTILILNGAGYGMAGGDGGDIRNAWEPVLEAHLFDPNLQTWSSAGKMNIARLYHSTAVLLADGRVVVGGSEMANYVDRENSECYPFTKDKVCTSAFEYRLEVYEPPYLFKKGEKPIISKIPGKMAYESTFGIVTLTDATKVDKVHAVRYSTSTHSTNTDQRLVELKIISANATYLYVEAPLNGAIAPPGSYHLFLLRNGIPSIAQRILFEHGPAQQQEPPLNPPVNNANTANTARTATFSYWIMFAMLALSIL